MRQVQGPTHESLRCGAVLVLASSDESVLRGALVTESSTVVRAPDT